MNLAEAYLRCEEITTAEARNFSYGIKLLPPSKRRAMSALYALARRIDDIGDGDGAAPAKLVGLAAGPQGRGRPGRRPTGTTAMIPSWSPWPTSPAASRSRSPPSTS